MVKFSEQFEAQIVPEWKEAFFDYFQIKNDLKKFTLLISQNKIHQHEKSPIKSLFFNLMKKFSLQGLHARHRGIQVHKKLGGGTEIGLKEELYETELYEQLADSEAAVQFFQCMDIQLNKVNQFYKGKEKEFVERGAYLSKQMDILMELNDVIKKQQMANKESSSQKHSIDDDDSISVTISDCDEEDSAMDMTKQEQKEQENSTYETDSSNVRFMDTSKPGETYESETPIRNKKEDGKMLSSRVFRCKGKKKLRIHVPLTNPVRTFSQITYLIWDDLMNKQPAKKYGSKGDNLHISRKNIKYAEKTIRGAFIDLYKGLGYLTTYRKLNILAFMKILEKFNKVTNKQVLPIYLRVVETSYFNSSDKVLKLSDEVEEIFVSYFAKDDKRKAIKYLKPEQPKESHTATFFLGLFSGCFLALLVGYIIMAHITGIYQPHSNFIYMQTAFPVLSMFSLLFLHVFLYGCNMYMWRKTRINYSFIFDLSSTKELKYRDVFLICAKSMTAVVGLMFLHLFLFAKGYNTQAQAIPGILLLVFLMVLVCPFNIMYKSSRYRLLSVLRNIILSPLYKVAMLDFFMADQLCSQVPMLRNLEYIACYYITESYKTQDYGHCMRNKAYMDLAYAVSFLPYYWRAMQCARRWFDEGQKSHLVNLGKYVSAMLAAGAKVAYEKERNLEWFCILVIVSSCATVYQLYWDFVKDWGLLQFNSKNPWLRDDLMLSRNYFYYFSMALNLILRLAWLHTVFPNSFGIVVDYRVTGLFLAALEIVRRCQWNFYRLENEHLNNAGKFRAVKTVPLPFHEVEDED